MTNSIDLCTQVLNVLSGSEPVEAVDVLTTVLASTAIASIKPNVTENTLETIIIDFSAKFLHMRQVVATGLGPELTPRERAFIIRKEEEISAKLQAMIEGLSA